MSDAHLARGKVGVVYTDFAPNRGFVIGQADGEDRPHYDRGWIWGGVSIPHAPPGRNPWAEVDPLVMLGDDLREWWRL